MPNTFVNLPLPALNGAGAAVDTSAMGIPKTIQVVGAFPNATVAIQVSEDAGTTWGTLTSFQNVGGVRVLNAVASRMRVFVQGRKASLPFSCDADVGAPDATPQFGTIPLPAGNGTGTPLDVSAFGDATTIVVEGTFAGAVIGIEISEDGSEPYAPLFSFSGYGGVKSATFTANFVRTRVSGRKTAVPFTAAASLGGVEASGGGGGGGGVDVENEEVALAGNPYSTIDFTSGVKADDVGGTVARVRSAVAMAALTYQPGGTETGPEVFDDWDDLYAKLVELRTSAGESGRWQIVMDDGPVGADITIPTTSTIEYDMTGVEWISVRGASSNDRPVLIVGTGGADVATFTHLQKITGLEVYSLQLDSPIIVDGAETLTLLDTLIGGQDEVDVIEMTAAEGGTPVLAIDDNSTLSTNAVTSAVTYEIHLIGVLVAEGVQSIQNDALSGIGTARIFIKEGSAQVEFDQPALTTPIAWNAGGNVGNIETLAWPFLPVITPVVEGGDPFTCILSVGYTNLVSGVEAQLPFASAYEKGDFIAIKNTGGTTLIVTSGDLIDGAASYTLNETNESVVLVSDGNSNWWVIASKENAVVVNRYVIPAQWARNDVAISLTDSQLNEQLSTNFDTYVAQRAGEITGISWRILGGPVTQGTLTVQPRVNGTPVATLSGVTTSASNQNGGRATATGDAYAAGAQLDVSITTTADFLPADTVNIEVMLEVSEPA